MRAKAALLVGAGVGYVLGTQEVARDAASTARSTVKDKVSEKVAEQSGNAGPADTGVIASPEMPAAPSPVSTPSEGPHD